MQKHFLSQIIIFLVFFDELVKELAKNHRIVKIINGYSKKIHKFITKLYLVLLNFRVYHYTYIIVGREENEQTGIFFNGHLLRCWHR